MNTPFLFAANWKMNMPFDRAIQFFTNNNAQLKTLSENNKKQLVFCPSFVALAPIVPLGEKTNIKIGAQNCCEHEKGSYTGEIDALSLQQIGCSYCIVGHSERRIYGGETDEQVAQKVKQLLKHNIQPILCIGENQHDYQAKKTISVLESQLKPVLNIISNHANNNNIINIAYEPIWSIGTGIIPETNYLTDVFNWIADYIAKKAIKNPVRLIYGGSVNPDNAPIIAKTQHINGFLIGNASLDFQKFQDIVLM